MINKYHINSSIRVKATFSLEGVETDPTSVILKIMNPNGDINSYDAGDLVHPSDGYYYKEILSDIVGDWWYEFTGTGAVNAAEENHYIISHSKFN